MAGLGFVSTESGALQSPPCTVDSRFNGSAGTSPEELIAAAAASSFSMHLALLLADAGFDVDHLDTTALVTLQADQRGFTISHVHLVLTASIPDLDNATFQSLASKAAANCAVSRLLNATTTLSVELTEARARTS